MITIIPDPKITEYDEKVVYYKKRQSLFFTWHEKIYRETIGRSLVITTNENYDEIFLNGEKIYDKH